MKRTLLVALLLVGCKDAADDYVNKSKQTEATLHLRKLDRILKSAVLETGGFPKGKAALTPATPCCKQPGGRCAPDPQLWSGSPWQELQFAIDEPHRFQYTYESDGQTFTATAVGDLDCDGSTITFVANGEVISGTAYNTVRETPRGKD